MWSDGDETLGVWLSVPSTVSAEIVARQPVSYVCIDTQHGICDFQSAVPMIQAIELAGNVPIARAPWNEPGSIGKLLDAGSHAIIVPMVNSRAEAEAAVRAIRYPPDGARSWGPLLTGVRHGDYREWAETNVAAIPMIETAEALASVDDIVSVPGVDAVYVGPADLAISLGLGPSGNDGADVFDDALARIVDACRRHDVVPGIHATGALAPRRREQGFRMITIASDHLAMASGIAAQLDAARSDSGTGASDQLY